ncbi:MAG: hypothetical protein JWR61_5744 [Ferruginibacter sp.]|nr:hypothetical protein [Ferruginibacter sp.]
MLLSIIFVLTTFILGGFVLNGLLRIPSQIANVIAIVVILVTTRSVYRKEGKDLSELGLNITLRDIGFGISGIVIGGIFIVPVMYTITLVRGYPIVFNPSFSLSYILNGYGLYCPQ